MAQYTTNAIVTLIIPKTVAIFLFILFDFSLVMSNLVMRSSSAVIYKLSVYMQYYVYPKLGSQEMLWPQDYWNNEIYNHAFLCDNPPIDRQFASGRNMTNIDVRYSSCTEHPPIIFLDRPAIKPYGPQGGPVAMTNRQSNGRKLLEWDGKRQDIDHPLVASRHQVDKFRELYGPRGRILNLSPICHPMPSSNKKVYEGSYIYGTPRDVVADSYLSGRAQYHTRDVICREQRVDGVDDRLDTSVDIRRIGPCLAPPQFNTVTKLH